MAFLGSMHSIDGFSERRMRDTSGDRTAGQQLAREADKITRELQNNGPASAKDFVVRNEARNLRQVELQGGEPRHSEQQQRSEQRAAEQRGVEQRATEQRRAQRFDSLTVEQQRAEQRLSEQRLNQQRTEEQRRAEQRETQAKPESDAKFRPSAFDGRNWQKDGSGNFVTRNRDGRLLTADSDGKLVDYKSHMSQKHMASQDQMAFISVLFCNPMMLLGMGGIMTMMDQAHGAKMGKGQELLNKKFDGAKANKQAQQSGYSSEIQRKAALIAQYTRPMEGRDVSQMGGLAGIAGLAGMSAAVEREDLKKRQDKKRLDTTNSNARRVDTKISMPQDRYSMNAKKLAKTKKLLEDEIEKVRGKASLEEVSRLYAQVEVLEKALKRLANF
ncbi:hypothetical protein KF707_20210 [Candidatus Obscuribacterales bacterium]|nr:hypothetical protein [Candidatus Obscuribacterales bacterium]